MSRCLFFAHALCCVRNGGRWTSSATGEQGCLPMRALDRIDISVASTHVYTCLFGFGFVMCVERDFDFKVCRACALAREGR